MKLFQPHARPRRLALTAAALAATLAAATSTLASADGTSDPTTARFFAPDSFWNQLLPADAPLDPASDALVADLVAEVAREQAQGTGPWISTKNSTPLYTVPQDQPTVRVALDSATQTKLQAALERVPLPPGAVPAKGEDGHLTVWQPSTDTLWELYRAREEADGWHAKFGGAMQNVSTSIGHYSTAAWPGATHRWGATATSLPVIGGVMTLDDFEAGDFDHALAVNLPAPRKTEYSWPAQRTDGNGSAKAIPEGARFRLDPSLDLDALSMHPVARMMAEAVQQYGMVVRDRSKAVTFSAENPTPTGTDPYRTPDGGYFRGKPPRRILATFPWDRLQLLQMSLCADSRQPCPRG
ncbi:hypothetical protein BH20GEM1_BH20GEM1_11460 [soil metagenome]